MTGDWIGWISESYSDVWHWAKDQERGQRSRPDEFHSNVRHYLGFSRQWWRVSTPLATYLTSATPFSTRQWGPRDSRATRLSRFNEVCSVKNAWTVRTSALIYHYSWKFKWTFGSWWAKQPLSQALGDRGILYSVQTVEASQCLFISSITTEGDVFLVTEGNKHLSHARSKAKTTCSKDSISAAEPTAFHVSQVLHMEVKEEWVFHPSSSRLDHENAARLSPPFLRFAMRDEM